MWDGTFISKSITDHFDVVNIREDNVQDIVEVTIIFDASPDKEYVFLIDSERFRADKSWIGKEVLRQLKGLDKTT